MDPPQSVAELLTPVLSLILISIALLEPLIDMPETDRVPGWRED